jgi:hypothetical protein
MERDREGGRAVCAIISFYRKGNKTEGEERDLVTVTLLKRGGKSAVSQ